MVLEVLPEEWVSQTRVTCRLRSTSAGSPSVALAQSSSPAPSSCSSYSQRILPESGSQSTSRESKTSRRQEEHGTLDPTIRTVLELAYQETLKQLAQDGYNNEMFDQTVDAIVSKVLSTAANTIDAAQDQHSAKPELEQVVLQEPLLADLVAVPWVIGHSRPDPCAAQRRMSRRMSWPDASPPSSPTLKTKARAADASNADTTELPTLLKSIQHISSDPACMSEKAVLAPSAATDVSSRANNLKQLESAIPPCTATTSETAGLSKEVPVVQPTSMRWLQKPKAVLVVTKKGSSFLEGKLVDMSRWLLSQSVTVILEPRALQGVVNKMEYRPMGMRTFSEADCLDSAVDLVVTIGGDGTLTWAVSLFKRASPPILSFAAGSLGFLTPFRLDDWFTTLVELFGESCKAPSLPIVLRMRLTVTLPSRLRQLAPHSSKPIHCLNEILVHRGQSGALSKLYVSVNDERVTVVQGDGLILATPTGSTAYSLAAGGSMVHPAVPAILLTPVSPHSLSFRPALLPDSAVIRIAMPLTARDDAAVSVDGQEVCVLKRGDVIEVTRSAYSVPTVCHTTGMKDWFGSVQTALQWNQRAEQQPC